MAKTPALKVLSVADWRKAAKAGDDMTKMAIRKTYTPSIVKAPDADLTLDFVISTQAVDRDQDTVAVDGWDYKNYLKNPVVLWAHTYNSFPVARSLSLSVGASGLKSRALFMSKELQDTHPSAFGYTVYQLYVEKLLNAVSVGFIPKKYVMVNDAENGRQWGYDMLEQELLEYSCVPVPSNPEALVEARGKGIDMTPVREWAEKFLQGEHGDGFWAPRDLVERTFYIVSGKGASVLVNRGKAGNTGGGDDPDGDVEQIMQDMQTAHDAMKSAFSAQTAGHAAMADHLKALAAAKPGSPEHKTLHGVAMKCLKAFMSDRNAAEAAHNEIGGALAKLFPPKADDAGGGADDGADDGKAGDEKAAKGSSPAKFHGEGATAIHAAMKAAHEAQASVHGMLAENLKYIGASDDTADDDEKAVKAAGDYRSAAMASASASLKSLSAAHDVMGALHKCFGHAMKALSLGQQGDTTATGNPGKALDVAGVLEAVLVLGKSGARHSAADLDLLNKAHRALVDLGSDCKDLPAPQSTGGEEAVDLEVDGETFVLKDMQDPADDEIVIDDDPAADLELRGDVDAALKDAGLDPADVAALVKSAVADALAGK